MPVLSPERIQVIVPGVDPQYFHPDVDGSGVRARLGIAPDTPLVAMIATAINRTCGSSSPLSHSNQGRAFTFAIRGSDSANSWARARMAVAAGVLQ